MAAANSIPVEIDEGLAARIAEHEREVRERIARGKKLATLFAGLSLEAVLIGVGCPAWVSWADVVEPARRAQLDIDEAELRRKLKRVRGRIERAIAGLSAAPADRIKACRAYDRARVAENRIEAALDRIFEERMR